MGVCQAHQTAYIFIDHPNRLTGSLGPDQIQAGHRTGPHAAQHLPAKMQQ